METQTVTIKIDPAALGRYEDSHVAALWHVAQINPAEFGDRDAGELVEKIGREIIHRWLRATRPELYKHQGRDHYWAHLRRLGKWVDGKFVPTSPPAEESTP